MNAVITGKLSAEQYNHVVEDKVREIRRRMREEKRREKAKREAARSRLFNPIRGLEVLR